MHVEVVPCFSDNYAYLIIDDGVCVIVDASEEAPLRKALGARIPTAIFATHHHHDHVGANEAFGGTIYGHRSDEGRLPGLTHPLDDGDRFTVGPLEVRVHHVPGHTLGALAYEVTRIDQTAGPRWVFTGDTFFLAGCGRVFEGTPEQMHTSLQRIAALGDDVMIACGHEYTASNLKFAAHVEPDNGAIRARLETVTKLRAKDAATFARLRSEKDKF